MLQHMYMLLELDSSAFAVNPHYCRAQSFKVWTPNRKMPINPSHPSW